MRGFKRYATSFQFPHNDIASFILANGTAKEDALRVGNILEKARGCVLFPPRREALVIRRLLSFPTRVRPVSVPSPLINGSLSAANMNMLVH